MHLKPKQVQCNCGHIASLETKNARCIKCGQFVFYTSKDKKLYNRNHFYVVGMIAAVVTFLTYVFIELIAVPLS